MSLQAEKALTRIFGDQSLRRFGTGWISDVLAVVLGLLCVLAVLCLHFPQWLTQPELRSRYPLPLVRQTIDWSIFAVLALSGLSLLLRPKKALGLAGLGLAGLALALGAGGVEIGRSADSTVYIGLDWFVPGVLSTAALFVPLERAFALRREQGPFRRRWLTDTQYFFMSHAMVQLMSVLVLAPAVALARCWRSPKCSRRSSKRPLSFSSSAACWSPTWLSIGSTARSMQCRGCGASTRCITLLKRWTG